MQPSYGTARATGSRASRATPLLIVLGVAAALACAALLTPPTGAAQSLVPYTVKNEGAETTADGTRTYMGGDMRAKRKLDQATMKMKKDFPEASAKRQKRDEQKAADEARQVEEATEAERTAKLAKEMAEKQAQTDAATADAASAQEAAKQVAGANAKVDGREAALQQLTKLMKDGTTYTGKNGARTGDKERQSVAEIAEPGKKTYINVDEDEDLEVLKNLLTTNDIVDVDFAEAEKRGHIDANLIDTLEDLFNTEETAKETMQGIGASELQCTEALKWAQKDLEASEKDEKCTYAAPAAAEETDTETVEEKETDAQLKSKGEMSAYMRTECHAGRKTRLCPDCQAGSKPCRVTVTPE